MKYIYTFKSFYRSTFLILYGGGCDMDNGNSENCRSNLEEPVPLMWLIHSPDIVQGKEMLPGNWFS